MVDKDREDALVKMIEDLTTEERDTVYNLLYRGFGCRLGQFRKDPKGEDGA